VKTGRAATGAGMVLIAVLVASGVAAQGISAPFAHTIRPRGLAEECFELAAGQSIGYAFESSAQGPG